MANTLADEYTRIGTLPAHEQPAAYKALNERLGGRSTLCLDGGAGTRFAVDPLLHSGSGRHPKDSYYEALRDNLAEKLGAVRLDSLDMSTAAKTKQGFLRLTATVARVGVIRETTPDGKVRRELRDESELFKQTMLDSLNVAPVVFGHPQGGVTPRNTSRVEAGHVVGGTARRGGTGNNALLVDIVLTDHDAISKVESGNYDAVLGYTSGVEEAESGPAGAEPHDARQKNISAQYVALVKRGEGEGEVRLNLDGDNDPGFERAQRLRRAEKAWLGTRAVPQQSAGLAPAHRLDGEEDDVEAIRAARIKRAAEAYKGGK